MKHRRVDNCDLLLEGDPRTLQQQIIDYIISLREENKLNANTINSRVSPVKKFYETNDVELRWNRIKSYIGKGRNKKYKKDRPYTHLEIQKMLEKADQRGRIAILLMSSSGIRVGALTSLKLRNLERIDKYNIYKMTVYENENEEYITFCTPECAAAIDSYLEYRQRHGEHPLNESAPVIREEFDISDEIRATRPRTLAEQSFRKMIRDIGLRSGVMEKMPKLEEDMTDRNRQRRPVKETHGFRKFFQTTAINAGMAPIYAEFLMGHASGGLALESYVRPTETDLLEGNNKMIGFVGVIDSLTMNEEHKLRREVQTLKQDATRFDRMAKEIEELKLRIGMSQH
jgi:integrase